MPREEVGVFVSKQGEKFVLRFDTDTNEVLIYRSRTMVEEDELIDRWEADTNGLEEEEAKNKIGNHTDSPLFTRVFTLDDEDLNTTSVESKE